MANDFNGLDKAIMKRVRDDWDSVIGISGDEGVGKSELAIQFGRACDPNFGIEEKHILFQPKVDQMKQAVSGLPKYSVIDADEAIRILWKHRRFERLQLYLRELYTVARQYNQISLLCMPRFSGFVEDFRWHRIKIWIQCINRGRAAVLFRGDNFVVDDPWFLDDAAKHWRKVLHGRRIAELNDAEVAEVFTKLFPDTYWGLIYWDKLDTESKRIYKELKAKNASLEFENEDDNIWRKRTMLLAYYMGEIGLPDKLIAQTLNVQRSAISDWPREIALFAPPTAETALLITIMKKELSKLKTEAD